MNILIQIKHACNIETIILIEIVITGDMVEARYWTQPSLETPFPKVLIYLQIDLSVQ